MTMTSLKDVQGQSSCFNSLSLLLLSLLYNHTHVCMIVFVFYLLLYRQLHWRTHVFVKKQRSQLFSFHETEQLKNMYAPCVDVTLHLISISAGVLQHLPCMQPSYIHNSRSHPLSIWMSLSCNIHCANAPLFKPHLLSWPFPCSHTQV